MKRLHDKVCVITGTGGSIGRAAALRFAGEGALVVGCDTSVEAAEETVRLVRAAGGAMASLHPVDLTAVQDCQRVVDGAVLEYGRIDVLFNNAAFAHFNWIEEISEEEWHANTRSEVDLVFFLTKAAWPYLKHAGGSVINMASLTGWRAFRVLPGLAHATAKMGIVGMTRQLAMEGSSYEIRVNSISPGIIETAQTRAQLNDADWRDSIIGETLLGRLGKPEEVANVALFLASDESSFITGIDIKVDGGMAV
ncbi:MAG TPA: SDR family NAD(P)-dependent oxidoreductase [Candidatus Elarobacter sp.]|nr:SDR family NAD(P)-dependent oxidoreductase [Candidatus Elarobacter sp.]